MRHNFQYTVIYIYKGGFHLNTEITGIFKVCDFLDIIYIFPLRVVVQPNLLIQTTL